MENPATWGEAEKIIDAALQKIPVADGYVYGLSNARLVADALRAAGLLKEETLPDIQAVRAEAKARDCACWDGQDCVDALGSWPVRVNPFRPEES